jgi:hypothetical protein
MRRDDGGNRSGAAVAPLGLLPRPAPNISLATADRAQDNPLSNVPASEPIPMTGDDLTKDQTQKMADALFPSINYLVRLKQRMQAQGFEPGDPLAVLTEKAYGGGWGWSGDLFTEVMTLAQPLRRVSAAILDRWRDLAGWYRSVASK